MLETLAAIRGVEYSVTVGGVTLAFEAILSLAMMSDTIAYIPKEEECGKRMQKYKLGRYYDSSRVWSQGVFDLYPPRLKKTPPAYECCKVCDWKPPLILPRLWRLP